MYKYVNRLNTICKPIFHYYLTLMSEVEGAGSLITVHTHIYNLCPYVEGIGDVPGKSIQSMSCEMEF